MSTVENTKILVISASSKETVMGRSVNSVIESIKLLGSLPIIVNEPDAGLSELRHSMDIACVLLDWDVEFRRRKQNDCELDPGEIIKQFKKINRKLPMFIYTECIPVNVLSCDTLNMLDGYLYMNEDTPVFIAKRLVNTSYDYISRILPPFFKALRNYVKSGKYSCHSPGHQSGVAFMLSPPGKVFYDFFGDHILRADLSSSVVELGSLLSHEGPIGESEEYAASVYGSDYTYFVTNGTSTSNKMVFQGCVTSNDIVLVDRNSHKSSMQAIQIGNYKPVYVAPVRNKYGMIGPIPMKEFSKESFIEKAKKLPYISEEEIKEDLKFMVLTQSTYDGILYNVDNVLKSLDKMNTKNILFDEAWFGYGHFHPFYKKYHAMNEELYKDEENKFKGTVFASQSAHKTLATFSQGSVVHLKNSNDPFIKHRFNNSFQANTTTSPFYPLIASIDISTAIMDMSGEDIVDTVLKQAIEFRRRMETIRLEMAGYQKNKWWFKVWGPDNILYSGDDVYKPKFWKLPASGKNVWHGFQNIKENQYILDPLRISIITIDDEHNVSIPAIVISKYLESVGVVMEKTGFFTLLSLTTIATLRGKSATLITSLMQFKNLYDNNTPLKVVFPQEEKADLYEEGKIGLRDFCEIMRPRTEEMDDIQNQCFENLPEVAMVPNKALNMLNSGNVDWVEVEQLTGRISTVLLVAYPPGIPMIMPGEVFNKKHTKLVVSYAHFEEEFPGYSYEVHGLIRKKGKWYVPCVKQQQQQQQEKKENDNIEVIINNEDNDF